MNHSLSNDDPNKRTEHCVLGVQFSFISCTFSTLQVNQNSTATRADELVFLRISKLLKWNTNSAGFFIFILMAVMNARKYLNHGTEMKNKIDRLNGSLWLLNKIKSLNVFEPSLDMDAVDIRSLDNRKIGLVECMSSSMYPHSEDNNIHIHIDRLACSVQFKFHR